MRINLLIILACHLLIKCRSDSECQMPTEEEPFSICSFCTESHAGVRWTVHESNAQKYPANVFGLDIDFICNNTENTTTSDDCFDGHLFPAIYYVSNPSVWHWHILGQTFSEGTDCVFTAYTVNGYNLPLSQRSTSCKIHSSDSSERDTVVLATCLEDNQNSCSCQCGDGFMSKALIDLKYGEIFTCTNRNECTEGTHECIDGYTCVDTEGSYSCINETIPGDNLITTVVSKEVTPKTLVEVVTKNISAPITSTLPPKSPGIMISSVQDPKVLGILNSSDQKPINQYAPATGTVTAVAIFVVFFVVIITSTVIVVLILYALRKKKLKKRGKITIVPSHFTTDKFDPDFRPVDFEKFDFSSGTEIVSLKSVLNPLHMQSSDDIDLFSTTHSIGSTITLNNYID